MLERNYTSLRLEITSRCNINCVYCHNSEYSNKNDDLTTKEIILLISNMKQKYPINKILITGGKPLINPDIVEIVRHVTSLGIKADLVTNGKLLTKEKILELHDAGLGRIRLSIDGLEEHKLFRKGSDPDELWNLAQFTAEKKLMDVCIHTVCSSHNVKTLFEVYKKVLEVGANRWRVFDIGYKGAIFTNKNLIDFKSYYVDFFNASKKIIKDYIDNNRESILDIEINNIFRTDFLKMNYNDFKDIKIVQAVEERLKISPCDYISHQSTVRSNGIATFCQFHHRTIFDFRKYNFDIDKAIMNSNKPIENELIMEDLYCKDCRYCLVCNSGCRARAEILTGDIKDADPVCCFLHPLVHKEIMPILPLKVQQIYEKLCNYDGMPPKYTANDLEILLKEHDFIF